MKIKFSIIKTLTVISALCFIYFTYKDINAVEDLKGYYITQGYFFLILFIIFLVINFASNIVKTYFLILFFSSILSFYLFESYIFYSGNIKIIPKNKETQVHEKHSIQKELKKHNGFAYFSVNNDDLISFSSISNSKIVFCNEPGYFTQYNSDRNGFNNPNHVWENDSLDVVIVGDSMVHGACVDEGKDMSSQVRSMTNLNTINIGWSSAGPLREYATYLEYIKKKPKYLFWVYDEKSDLVDLSIELKNNLLMKYYNDENFTQDLINKRQIIDSLLKKKHEEFMQTNFDQSDFVLGMRGEEMVSQNFINFIKLYKTKQFLMFNFHKLIKENDRNDYNLNNNNELNIFLNIINKVKKITDENNTKLVLVYLPAEKYEFSKRYDYLNNIKKEIFKNMKEKKIGIIDIDRLIKENFVFPNKLYAKQSPELHFNESGYKFIAEKIVEFINENEVK